MTTSAPNELYLVLRAFKPALASIDLRCVAVSSPSEEYWQNLVTSILLSDRTVDEIRHQQEAIPEIRNESFAIFCGAFPFSHPVLEKIGEGQLIVPTSLGRNKIKFRDLDLGGLRLHYLKEWRDGSSKSTLRASDLGSEEERKELWSIVDKQSMLLARYDFGSIQEMIEQCLKIRYSIRERKDIEVVIYPPATIEHLEFRNNNLEVVLENPSRLKGLQLNLSTKRGNETIWRCTRKIEFQKAESRDNPEVFKTTKLSPFDFLYVKLIHWDSGLTLDEKSRKVPITNVTEPFLKTFDCLCSIDKLEKMLFEPENYGKNPDKIFERAVTWLLSLAGYEVVHLGMPIKKLNGRKKKEERFDTLFSETGYHIGSADIIAYEGSERILLIDCELGPVDPKKVQKLAELKKHFREKLKGYEKLPIIPVLFSPTDFRKSSPSIDVMIADQAVIRRIFEAVVQGNREKARSTLYYPGF